MMMVVDDGSGMVAMKGMMKGMMNVKKMVGDNDDDGDAGYDNDTGDNDAGGKDDSDDAGGKDDSDDGGGKGFGDGPDAVPGIGIGFYFLFQIGVPDRLLIHFRSIFENRNTAHSFSFFFHLVKKGVQFGLKTALRCHLEKLRHQQYQ